MLGCEVEEVQSPGLGESCTVEGVMVRRLGVDLCKGLRLITSTCGSDTLYWFVAVP